LKKIINDIKATPVQKLADKIEWEDPILMTEIEEYEPR